MKRTSGNAKVEDMFTTVTDERGRITNASYNDMSQVSVEYNDAERQEVRKCKIGESQVTTTIQYDALDRIDFVKTNGVQTGSEFLLLAFLGDSADLFAGVTPQTIRLRRQCNVIQLDII